MRKEAHEILYSPRLNKGTAFGEAERELLGLTGLFPDAVEDSATQQRRALAQLAHRANDLERYIYLSELQDRNERLFYQLLRADPPRHMPLVGPVQLHHAHYKCTVYFQEVTRVGWPVPHTLVDEDCQEVLYIDHDHLHMVGDVDTGCDANF